VRTDVSAYVYVNLFKDELKEMSLRPAPVAPLPTGGATSRLQHVLEAGAETAPKFTEPKMPKRPTPYDPNWREKQEAAAARKAAKNAEETRKILEKKAKRDAELAAKKEAEEEKQRQAVRAMAMQQQAIALINSARYPPDDDRFEHGSEAREHLRESPSSLFPEKELRKAVYKRMKQIFGGTPNDNTKIRATIERIALTLELNLDKLEQYLLIEPVVKQPSRAGPSTITPNNPPLPVPADTPQKGLTPAQEAAMLAARKKRMDDRKQSPWEISKEEHEMADELNVYIGTPAP